MAKTNTTKSWKFIKSNDYYTDLAMRESSNRLRGDKDEDAFIGLYQMGKLALIDCGYIDKLSKGWTGKNGMISKEDFLSSRIVQNIAVREYHKIIWENYLKNYQKHEGAEINGIVLTKSGMISAAHLVGHSALKEFINSRGNINKEDGNHVTCTEYLKGFAGYYVDYSISQLMENLKGSQIASDNDSLEYSDSSSETGGQFEGTLGANKVINAKVSQLLSNPAQYEEYRQASLSEAMGGLKLADEIIPGLSRQSPTFAKENQEFMEQFISPTYPGEDFTHFAEMNFGAIPQNNEQEADSEFYANLGVTPDFNNLMNQHADLMGAINNSNPFGNPWQNEEQENCIIC